MINLASLRSKPTQPSKAPGVATPGVAVHRLFPALCALWLAALFGLGCLVASADALASLVVHLHLPAILPAAAPPLGQTARLALVVLLAGLGGTVGLVLGVVLHRRALARLRTAQPRAARSRAATIPQANPAPAPLDTTAPRVRSRDAHPDAPPRRPLVVTEDVLPYPTAVGHPAEPFVPAAHSAPFEQSEVIRIPAFDEVDDENDGDEHDLPPFLAAAMSSSSTGHAPIVVSPAEPVIVPALADADMFVAEEAETTAAPVSTPTAPISAASPAPQASPPPLASLAATAPQIPLDEAPLGGLGLVQLIERLALAIAKRQAHHTPAPFTPNPIDAVDPRMPLHRFDPLTMDPAGPLLRAKPTKANAILPPSEDEDDATRFTSADPHAHLHDPLASMSDWADDMVEQDLPPRHLGLTKETRTAVATRMMDAKATEDDTDSTDHTVPEHRYSSLSEMTMRRPELMPTDLSAAIPALDGEVGPAEPAAVPTEPVLRFPSRVGSEVTTSRPETVSDEADRALREALATLRRMSGQR